jgi:Putative prokaryotic signal transducing protein
MKRIKLILNEVQWSVAKGMLEEAGIPFSVLNEQFSSLYPGVGLGAFGREIIVADEDEEKARERLGEFLE